MNRIVRISGADGSYAPHWLLAANISPGGLFIRATQPPAPGSRVEVAFVDRQRAIPFSAAEVVWSKVMMAGFGLRFVDLPPESQQMLAAFFPAQPTPQPEEPPARESTLKFSSFAAPPKVSRRGVRGALLVGGALLAAWGVYPLLPPPHVEPVAVAARVAVPRAAPPLEVEEDEALLQPLAAQAPLPVVPKAPDVRDIPFGGPLQAIRISVVSPNELVLELRLAPGGHLQRHFILTGPDRLVMDLDGSALARPTRIPLEASAHIAALRLGRREEQTRLVVDFAQAPRRILRDGSRFRVLF